MTTTDLSSYYVWFDTEFTSLELEQSRLIQVAAVVTNHKLERVLPLEDDLVVDLRLPPDTRVSAWTEQNLGALLARCRSDSASTVEEADEKLCELLARAFGGTVPELDQHKVVLGGNSLHGDWFLARKFLPRFSRQLNYRHLDVSAIKLEWLKWYGGEEFDKENVALLKQYLPETGSALETAKHDALYDVMASMAELAYYRSQLAKRS